MRLECPEPERCAESDAGSLLQSLLEACLIRDELAIPSLPEVAVRVVRIGTRDSTSAEQLSDIIETDAALSAVVLRIASSAAKRPFIPIASLRHAVAWLGFNEVANIAFTLALQGKMLDVPGLQPKARRLWRHALASALWARQLALMLAEESGPCYLCGLLHDIGRVVALRTLHELAARSGVSPVSSDYDRLIEVFNQDIGARVVAAWQLPAPVPAVRAHWREYADGGAVRFQSNIVNVAHGLADYSIHRPTLEARDQLVTGAAYRDLGLDLEDGNPLFDSAAQINAELDRYLAP